MSTAVDLGQTVTWRASFKNSSGTAADPTTVTFRVRSPAGTETAYVYGISASVVRVSAGVFTMRLQLSTAGDWQWRVEGTGAVAACDESSIVSVRPSLFTTAQ